MTDAELVTYYLNQCISIFDISMKIGANLYPFLFGLNIIRCIAFTI